MLEIVAVRLGVRARASLPRAGLFIEQLRLPTLFFLLSRAIRSEGAVARALF
jgi:hypothetical protein